MHSHPPGLAQAASFPLVEALFGRRSRRFARGASIPDGPLAYISKLAPLPLSELEQMLVLTATAGSTGWHFLINRRAGTSGLPAYSTVAGGRTAPAAAGWHASELFFTNDEGVFLFSTRDAPALAEPDAGGKVDLDELLAAHRTRIQKLSEGRLHLPAQPPYVAKHNTWCANLPGTLLIIPVADVAQVVLAKLSYMVQNGACIYDDVHGERIAGLERFRHLVDVDKPGALSEFELSCLTDCTVEIGTGCYAGALMLQAMGLGGWMYTALNGNAILGASGDPDVPGLGFSYESDPRWPSPNPTGLAGVFEAHCPPHYADMRAAVEAIAARKFGPGGPYHADTPGPWRESAQVRSRAEVYSEEFKECVALMAQHIFDRFGKFPGTVPSLLIKTYLQAFHLDLDFYDEFFQPGAYLQTHAEHMAQWHPDAAE